MRVLHINEHLSWAGGVETYLLHLLPELYARGVELRYCYAQGDPGLFSAAISVPEVAQFGRTAEVAGYRRVSALLSEFAPDVIHVHRVYNLGVLRACLDYGPTVVTCHDHLYLCPAGSFFHRRTQTICRRQAGPACFAVTLWRHCMTPRPRYALAYYRRVRQFVAWRQRFAAVLCPSDSVRERLLEHGFPPERTHTLPYFCPLEPRDTPRPLPARPTLLFLGRVRPIKGYHVFLRALGMLPGVQGTLVGNASNGMLESVGRLAQQCGCRDRLEIRPWASRAEILELMERATIFVFPSIWPETLGIVGLEAMARGVPVVASDVGGVRQWLRHGENGLLVPPKDAPGFARAIHSLLDRPDRLLAMGQAGIDTVRAGFLPRHHLDKLLGVYTQVSRDTQGPAAGHRAQTGGRGTS